MDTSNKLIDALAVALETFSQGYDLIAETQARVSADRTKAINFAVDTAKAEGLASSDIVGVIDAEVFMPAVESEVISKPTRYQYRSGLIKALAHGVAWYPKAFELEAVQEPGKKAKGRPKANTKAVTLGAVKVDRKARTLEVKLGKSTDLEAFTAAITAVQSEPARVSLFLAYCKAQGWTK
jgi:hypothetical protein